MKEKNENKAINELTDKEKEKKWNRVCWVMLVRACFIPILMFAGVTVYLLGTPMTEWVFGLSRLNNIILEFLPQAQTWVNISVVYREKMILLFVVYSFFLFGSVLYMSVLVIKNRALRFNAMERDNHDKLGFKFKRIIGLLFIVILVYFSITMQFESASDVFLTYEELDNSSTRSIFTDYVRWSTLRGILFHSITKIFATSLFWLVLFQFLVSWYCKSKFFERIFRRIK